MALIDVKAARAIGLDLAERALNAAWQGALGAAIPIIVVANTADTLHLAWWQALLSAVLVGAISGLLSLVKGVLASLKTGTASMSKTVAQSSVSPGAHASDKTEQADLADQSAALAASALAPPVQDALTADSILADIPPVTSPTDTTGATA